MLRITPLEVRMNQATTNSKSDGVSVCIAANFTAEPIEQALSCWLRKLGIAAEIHFAPYNQVFQQLLEGGLLRSNRGGVNLVAIDIVAWLIDGSFEEARQQLDKTLDDFLAVLRASGAQGSGGAVLLFPAAEFSEPERVAAVSETRSRVLRACTTIGGWSALDLTPSVAMYSVAEVRDPFTDLLGHIPFTEEMYVVAATAAARWIRCTRTKSRKVIVLDCDNTLWQGVCGEGAVQVTPPYRKLQEFMLRQRDEGVLLAVASKNNEADVMAVLDSEDCLLRAEHLPAWQINWQPKSESLKALSEELGLALNSFLFLDDSPIECLEVRNACPEVMTVQLPQVADEIPSFLDHFWGFDRPPATVEDRNRASMYQAEKQRTELSRRALTREEFLASLQIEIHVAPATETDLPRVAQLTMRTTQFNMTGVQHTVQSLSASLAEPGNECWTVRVRDRFGDYGLVGAMVFESIHDSVRVDTFLLSCRALGRGVEDRMVEDLKRWALEHGADGVVVPFAPTTRNRPALEFLARLCDVPAEPKEPFECVLSASGTATEWRPAALPAATPQSAHAMQPKVAPEVDEAGVLAGIASQLRSVEAILAAVRSEKTRRPARAGAFMAPHTGIEESLARIWSDCLAVEPVGANDNFFEFGGQSLLATRVLARIRLEFGVEMGLSSLFERPTVAQMAAYIRESSATGTTCSASAELH